MISKENIKLTVDYAQQPLILETPFGIYSILLEKRYKLLGDFSFGNNSSFDAAKRYQVINCGLCATTFDFGVVPTLQTAKNFFCYIAKRITSDVCRIEVLE
ncbi:unnamed protein product [Rhizophagus irregularis]|nr:unnamed protein product [Rhizophagus irregularis]CAB5382154.1 unnamed protein product [Rhizophagus irregularis]